MSDLYRHRIWHQCSQRGAKRTVMLALSDHANEQGVVDDLDTSEIAALAGITKRHAQRVLDALELCGEIFISPGGKGRGDCARYLITCNALMSDIASVLEGDFGYTESGAQFTAGIIVGRHRKGDKCHPKEDQEKGDILDKRATNVILLERVTSYTPLNSHLAETDDQKDDIRVTSEPGQDRLGESYINNNDLDSDSNTDSSKPVPEGRQMSPLPEPSTWVEVGPVSQHHDRVAKTGFYITDPSNCIAYLFRYDRLKDTDTSPLLAAVSGKAVSARMLIEAHGNYMLVETVRVSKPKPEPKPWNKLTRAMHENIPDYIRPPGNPFYPAAESSARAMYEENISENDVADYVRWVYSDDPEEGDPRYKSGGPGGLPKVITIWDVQRNIKPYLMLRNKYDGRQDSNVSAGSVAAQGPREDGTETGGAVLGESPASDEARRALIESRNRRSLSSLRRP